MVKVIHGRGILQDLGDLNASRNELKDVAVILERTTLVFGSVPHLQRVLEDSHKLLDLPIVQDSCGDSSLGGKTLEEINPFGPFSVLWPLDGAHVLGQGNGKLILGDEIESTLRQSIVDLAEDVVLLLDVKIGRQVR